MDNIGEKIKNVRKKKGLSQEELAESATINLRTIQRIENNESEPRGKTLHLICDVLEINVEDILDYGKQNDNSFLVYMHLSVIIGLVIPIGNIILPFILWVTNKEKIIGLKSIGVNLLNFQIVWTFITFLVLMVGAFFKIIHFEIGPFTGNLLIVTTYFVFIIPNIVLSIIFAIMIRNGKIKNYYPNIIKFIR
ncbi:helix-turn-helix domain-containing protein [Sabulilitoribacter arenilitoris]|uniref:Helix-turn-helix domain-containing protein n=1 Tax=Wocania arenilitoris TaxID=2044858 RepID=A0AAE3JJH9_9FLAO|nr:helix-turn-helix domain-containing protein [Wocania arenilitoris]MCF7567008.1 helix-turn-helix domain-containing protein [Wocania arenilitoris]